LVGIIILQSLNSLLIKKGEKTSQICAHDRGTSCVVVFLIKYFSSLVLAKCQRLAIIMWCIVQHMEE
jgi:hypothetical protein